MQANTCPHVENINKAEQIEHVEQNEHVEEIKPTKKIEHDDETWSSGTLYGWVQHFDLQYKVPYYYCSSCASTCIGEN